MTVYIEQYDPDVSINGLNTNKPTNIIGASTKDGTNTVRGSLKVDVRPTGGSTSDYAEQIRANSGKTSGSFIGLDNESHLTATGTASVRSTQGVAVVDATYTATGSTLVGLYGQARADGTVAGSSFLAGVYGLIEEGGGAITASHVASGWFDSHRNTAVTGQHELLYLSNNGSATMDQALYIYGGDKIASLAELNTVGGGLVAKTGTAATGTPVKVHITVDGTDYWLNAYPTSNN